MRWTTGELKVRVRSLSEPDREVPLAMRLTAEPPCLEFVVAGEGSGRLATVSVKQGADLPKDDMARIHVVADPATELAMTLASAALPPGVPMPRPFPQMTADVQVHLVPYVLRIREKRQVGDGWTESQLASGQSASVEGDGRSLTILEVEMYRVDAGGSQVGEPVQANLRVSAQPGEGGATASWSVLEQTATALKVQFKSTKPLFASGPSTWGSLRFEGSTPGGRRLPPLSIPVQVKALQAEVSLVSPADGKVGLPGGQEGSPPSRATVRLSITDSSSRGVSGVAVEWKVEPVTGNLQPAAGTTGQDGIHEVTWTAPDAATAASVSQSPEIAIRISALAGPDRFEAGSASLNLKWHGTVTVKVAKKGFASQERKVALTSPGKVKVQVLAAPVPGSGRQPIPIAFATVSVDGATGATSSEGWAEVGKLPGGGDQATFQLSLDDAALDVVARLKALEPLATMPVAPDRFKAVVRDLASFAEGAFVEQLASQDPERWGDTMYSAKLLASTVRVQEMARRLLVRRYSVLSADFGNFCKNFAAALYSRYGEKAAGQVVGSITTRAKGLFSWAAAQLVRWKWTRAGLNLGVRALRACTEGFDALLKRFQDWFKRKGFFTGGGVPGKLTDRLPKTPDDGPFPVQRGQMVRPDYGALDKLEREASDALQGVRKGLAEAREAAEAAGSKITGLRTELEEAERVLAQSARDRTKGKWAARVQQLKGQIGEAEGALKQANRSLEDLGPKETSAQEALEQLKLDRQGLGESCSMMDDALSTMLGVLNRMWNFGTYVVVYVSAMFFGLFRPVVKKYANKYYPLLGETFWNSLDDLVFKAGFTDMVGGAEPVGIVPRLGRNLESRQLNAGAEALALALDRTKGFDLRPEDGDDRKRVEEAFRWYYETIEANSFTAEAWECYAEWFAETLDWIEFGVVWSCRAANAILALLALIFAIPSSGGSVAAFLALQPELTAFIESMDKVWDWVKAVARGGKAVVGVLEVAGVILPAHVAYTAKVYRDDAIMTGSDQAWAYPVPEGAS